MAPRSYFGKMDSTLGSVVPFAMFTINFFVGQAGAFSSKRRNTIFLITRDTIKGKEVEDPKCGPKLFARF